MPDFYEALRDNKPDSMSAINSELFFLLERLRQYELSIDSVRIAAKNTTPDSETDTAKLYAASKRECVAQAAARHIAMINDIAEKMLTPELAELAKGEEGLPPADPAWEDAHVGAKRARVAV